MQLRWSISMTKGSESWGVMKANLNCELMGRFPEACRSHGGNNRWIRWPGKWIADSLHVPDSSMVSGDDSPMSPHLGYARKINFGGAKDHMQRGLANHQNFTRQVNHQIFSAPFGLKIDIQAPGILMHDMLKDGGQWVIVKWIADSLLSSKWAENHASGCPHDAQLANEFKTWFGASASESPIHLMCAFGLRLAPVCRLYVLGPLLD